MTYNENPYQTPATTFAGVEQANSERVLASRWMRLLASLLDAVIMMIFFVPILYASGIFDGLPNSPGEPSLMLNAMLMLAGITIFLVLNGFMIHKNGQSIGKVICKIKIVRSDGSHMGLARFLLYRYLPITVISNLPNVGPILVTLDVLFIFQKSKKCLHDTIADTIVINA